MARSHPYNMLFSEFHLKLTSSTYRMHMRCMLLSIPGVSAVRSSRKWCWGVKTAYLLVLVRIGRSLCHIWYEHKTRTGINRVVLRMMFTLRCCAQFGILFLCYSFVCGYYIPAQRNFASCRPLLLFLRFTFRSEWKKKVYPHQTHTHTFAEAIGHNGIFMIRKY